MLKSYRVVGGMGWVAHEILVSAPVPFWGFGDLGVWGLGLDNSTLLLLILPTKIHTRKCLFIAHPLLSGHYII